MPMKSTTMDLRSTIAIKGIVTDENDTPKGLSIPSEVTLGELVELLGKNTQVTVANISDAGATGKAVAGAATPSAARTTLGVTVYDPTTAVNAIKNKTQIAALTSSSTAADIVAALKA